MSLVKTSIAINLRVLPGVTANTIRRWVEHDRRRLGLTGSLSLVTVAPVVSRYWNHKYRRRDRPTNILTFVEPRSKLKSAPDFLGEIILCPSVIKREARQQQRNYREYLRFLIQHGLIHLSGLDHKTVAQQRRWQKIEQRLSYA